MFTDRYRDRTFEFCAASRALGTMTDCCLCVCWRPPPHKRLVAALYPPRRKGNEADLLPVNAGKLTQFAVSRPSYLSALAVELSARARTDLRKKRFGFALIAMSALQQLVEACDTGGAAATDASALTMFDEYVVSIIHTAVASVAGTVSSGGGPPMMHVAAAGASLCARFLSGQDLLSSQARMEAFLHPLLALLTVVRLWPGGGSAAVAVAAPPAAGAGSPPPDAQPLLRAGDDAVYHFAAANGALAALNELLRKSTPAALQSRWQEAAPVLLPLLHGVLRAMQGAAPPVIPAAPPPHLAALGTVLAAIDACFCTVVRAMNAATWEGLLRPVLLYWDAHAWSPRPVVLHSLRLMDPTNQASAGVPRTITAPPVDPAALDADGAAQRLYDPAPIPLGHRPRAPLPSFQHAAAAPLATATTAAAAATAAGVGSITIGRAGAAAARGGGKAKASGVGAPPPPPLPVPPTTTSPAAGPPPPPPPSFGHPIFAALLAHVGVIGEVQDAVVSALTNSPTGGGGARTVAAAAVTVAPSATALAAAAPTAAGSFPPWFADPPPSMPAITPLAVLPMPPPVGQNRFAFAQALRRRAAAGRAAPAVAQVSPGSCCRSRGAVASGASGGGGGGGTGAGGGGGAAAGRAVGGGESDLMWLWLTRAAMESATAVVGPPGGLASPAAMSPAAATHVPASGVEAAAADAAGQLLAAQGHGGGAGVSQAAGIAVQVEREGNEVKQRLLSVALTLCHESTAPSFAALLPAALQTLMPCITDPPSALPPAAAASASASALRAQRTAAAVLVTLRARLTAPQDVMRLLADLCGWYIDHVTTYHFLVAAPPQSPERAVAPASAPAHPAAAVVPPLQPRLSRGASLAGGALTAALSLLAESARSDVLEGRLRIALQVWGAAAQLRKLVARAVHGGGFRGRLALSADTTRALEHMIIDATPALRAAAAATWHELLNVHATPAAGVDGDDDWRLACLPPLITAGAPLSVTDPVLVSQLPALDGADVRGGDPAAPPSARAPLLSITARTGSSSSVAAAGAAPGWLLLEPAGTERVLPLSSNAHARLHALLATSIAVPSDGDAESAASVVQLCLATRMARDLLRVHGAAGIWLSVALAAAVKSSVADRAGTGDMRSLAAASMQLGLLDGLGAPPSCLLPSDAAPPLDAPSRRDSPLALSPNGWLQPPTPLSSASSVAATSLAAGGADAAGSAFAAALASTAEFAEAVRAWCGVDVAGASGEDVAGVADVASPQTSGSVWSPLGSGRGDSAAALKALLRSQSGLMLPLPDTAALNWERDAAGVLAKYMLSSQLRVTTVAEWQSAMQRSPAATAREGSSGGADGAEVGGALVAGATRGSRRASWSAGVSAIALGGGALQPGAGASAIGEAAEEELDDSRRADVLLAEGKSLLTAGEGVDLAALLLHVVHPHTRNSPPASSALDWESSTAPSHRAPDDAGLAAGAAGTAGLGRQGGSAWQGGWEALAQCSPPVAPEAEWCTASAVLRPYRVAPWLRWTADVGTAALLEDSMAVVAEEVVVAQA